MIRYLIILTLGLIPSIVLAQKTETIHSDRPGQAMDGRTVGKQVFQLQTGVQFQGGRTNTGSSGEVKVRSYTLDTYLRYGLSERFELSLGTAGNFYSEESQVPSYDSNITSLLFWDLGLRYNLYNGGDYGPIIGLYLGTTVYNNSRFGLGIAGFDNTLKAIYSQSFRSGLSVNTNIGIALAELGDASLVYALNLGYGVNDNWSVFGEAYGDYIGGFWIPGIDVGASYVVNSDLQLDFYTGRIFSPRVDFWFFNVGLSYRFGRGMTNGTE